MDEALPLLWGGEWVMGEGGILEDRSPYDGRIIARVSLASQAQIERAIAVAWEAFREYRRLAAHRRGQMLLSVSPARRGGGGGGGPCPPGGGGGGRPASPARPSPWTSSPPAKGGRATTSASPSGS